MATNALNFGLLNAPDAGTQFIAGAQDAQNAMLKQQNMRLQEQQISAMADQRRANAEENRAQAEQRKAATIESQRRQQFLGQLNTKLAEGGHKLTRETLSSMMTSGIPEVQQLGMKGLQEMMAEEKFQALWNPPAGQPGQPTSQAPQTPMGQQAVAAATFDIPGAQQQINRLLTSNDPRAQAAANQLQRQIDSEYRRQDNVRTDERQRSRDQQAADDRAEARALRLAIAANGRGRGGKGGSDDDPAKEAGKGVVTVRDEDGTITSVTKADAVRRGLIPVSDDPQLTPKEIQKREANHPKAKLALGTVETGLDNLAKDLDTLAKHPGLDGITGVVYGRTPSLTPSAREAQALYDKIVARGGFSELQAMRNSSPTGGALGSVSDREGAQLRQAFAEIGREQSTGSVKAALTRAAQTARDAKTRTREAFEDTYDYRQSTKPTAAPKPAASKSGASVSNW